MRMIVILGLVTGLFAGPASSQSPGERLVKPPLAGFVIGYEATSNGSSMLEQIPIGETVDRWSRMVTTQRFARLASKTNARTFLTELAASVIGACPGAKTSPVTMRGPTAIVRADCPRNPTTGKPETFWAEAIMGASDLHVIQVAYRRVPSSADVVWAETYLAGVSLCRADNRQGACAKK